MKQRATRVFSAILLLSAGLSAHSQSAQAMGMGIGGDSAPGKSGYSRIPIVETHAEALSKSWRRAEDSWDKDYATLNASVKGYETTLAAARKVEADAAAALARAEASRTREQANLDALNGKVSELDRASLNNTISAVDRERQIREIEKNKQDAIAKVERERLQVTALSAELGKAKTAVEQVQGQIQTHLKKTYDQDVDVRAMNPEDLKGTVARMNETILKDRKARQVEKVTDELFDRVKDDYLKSELLVSDLNTLKQQYGYAGDRLETLKRITEKRLNDTLLGNYVQEQVKKAISKICGNSQYQAACAAGNIQSVNELLDGILRGTRPDTAVSGSTAAKPVEAPSGAARAPAATAGSGI